MSLVNYRAVQVQLEDVTRELQTFKMEAASRLSLPSQCSPSPLIGSHFINYNLQLQSRRSLPNDFGLFKAPPTPSTSGHSSSISNSSKRSAGTPSDVLSPTKRLKKLALFKIRSSDIQQPRMPDIGGFGDLKLDDCTDQEEQLSQRVAERYVGVRQVSNQMSKEQEDREFDEAVLQAEVELNIDNERARKVIFKG